MATKAERILSEALDSLESALKIASRADTVGVEDLQRLRTAANQAAQATANLNQLVGIVEYLRSND